MLTFRTIIFSCKRDQTILPPLLDSDNKIMGQRKIPRTLKICGGATAILMTTLFAAVPILSLAILKPKQPKITTQEVTLVHLNLLLNPLHLNITLGLVVTVNNPNYASFKYDKTTAYTSYRDTTAVEAPIAEDTIPARGKHDISTDVLVIVDNLVKNPYFSVDYRRLPEFYVVDHVPLQSKIAEFLENKDNSL